MIRLCTLPRELGPATPAPQEALFSRLLVVEIRPLNAMSHSESTCSRSEGVDGIDSVGLQDHLHFFKRGFMDLGDAAFVDA
jgi:hypothetical protein